MAEPMRPGLVRSAKVFMGKVERPEEDGPEEEDSVEEERGRTLKVMVDSATNLKDMDTTFLIADASDPYVVCEAISEDGETRSSFTTPVIDNCHDPVWNHAGIITDFREGDNLVFHIWDSDTLKPDDPLGRVVVKYQQLQPFFLMDAELDVIDDDAPATKEGEEPKAGAKLKVRVFLDFSSSFAGGDGSDKAGLIKLCPCYSCCKCCCWCCNDRVMKVSSLLIFFIGVTGWAGWQAGVLQKVLDILCMYVYVGVIGVVVIGLVLYELWQVISGFVDGVNEQLNVLSGMMMASAGSIGNLLGLDVRSNPNVWKAKRSPLPEEDGSIQIKAVRVPAECVHLPILDRIHEKWSGP